jgi:hypothetical protein
MMSLELDVYGNIKPNRVYIHGQSTELKTFTSIPRNSSRVACVYIRNILSVLEVYANMSQYHEKNPVYSRYDGYSLPGSFLRSHPKQIPSDIQSISRLPIWQSATMLTVVRQVEKK